MFISKTYKLRIINLLSFPSPLEVIRFISFYDENGYTISPSEFPSPLEVIRFISDGDIMLGTREDVSVPSRGN